MIHNQENPSVEIIGQDYQKNKVGIDAKNINFITSLLTSNLYSNPIQSFLRETVSNAWDSQVEAGNTNVPILIRIHKNEDEIELSVRDYGTGLSPERFDTIYKNIGSSTKRESNDYIGMLGIGRFASLSVSDTSHIKSYYNGKCYSYLMYKDGDSLNIDLLNTTDTEFDNGVEISVTIKDSWQTQESIRDGLDYLNYFEQLYVDNNIDNLSDFVYKFNKRTIHEFKTFKICSVNNFFGTKFLMGNVLYECNEVKWKIFNNANIAITFDIGELSVTPNREQLRFNDKTIETINNRVKACEEEILALFKERLDVDYNTVEEWFKTTQHSRITLPLGYSTNIEIITDRQYLRNNHIFDNCTIRGKKIHPTLATLYTFVRQESLPPFFLTYVYTNQKFYTSSHTTLASYLDNDAICTYLDEPYKPITKQYLSSCNSYKRIYYIRKNQLRYTFYSLVKSSCKWYLNRFPQYKSIDKQSFRLIIEEIKDKFSKIPTFNNSDVPKQFIKEQKVKKQGNAERRKFVVYELHTGRFYKSVSYKSDRNLQYYIDMNRPVVYAEKGNTNLEYLFRLFSKINANVTFISVSKSNITILQNVKRFVYIDDYIKNNHYLKAVFTGKYISEKLKVDYVRNLYLNEEYQNIVSRLNKYLRCYREVDMYEKLTNTLYTDYTTHGKLDYALISDVFDSDFVKLHDFLNNMSCTYDTNIIMIMYIIYKNNLKLCNINRITAFKYLQKHCII